MTEEISPIYEQVSIESWADSIHEIKTRELAELVTIKEVAIKTYFKSATANNTVISFEGMLIGTKMLLLNKKLKMLQEHGRK